MITVTDTRVGNGRQGIEHGLMTKETVVRSGNGHPVTTISKIARLMRRKSAASLENENMAAAAV